MITSFASFSQIVPGTTAITVNSDYYKWSISDSVYHNSYNSILKVSFVFNQESFCISSSEKENKILWAYDTYDSDKREMYFTEFEEMYIIDTYNRVILCYYDYYFDDDTYHKLVEFSNVKFN